MESNKETLRRWLPAALMGIIAFALVLEITEPFGPGLDPDALQYMGAAESVAAHASYRVPIAFWSARDSMSPMVHFPPGYATTLAIPVRLGMAPTQGARLVQAVAACVTVTVLVLLVSAATTTVAGVALALTLFAMTAMHEVHVSVLSEPLFLACLTLVLAAMAFAPTRPWRAGIPAAVGVMTRYAGVALVGAAALWALLEHGSVRQRLQRATRAVLPAVLLQGTWVIRSHYASTGEPIRNFALYGKLGPTLAEGGETLSAWLVPDAERWDSPMPHHGALALAAGLVLVAVVLAGAWRARMLARDTSLGEAAPSPALAWRTMRAASLLLVCYLGIIAVSRVVADPGIPLDERILAPALLLAMTLSALGIASWWRAPGGSALARIALAGALLGWWYAAGSVTLGEARYVLESGSDFANESWRESETLAWAREHGAGTPLFSNWPAPFYFYLHRPTRELPRVSDARTLAKFADTVRVRGGRVLVFDVQSPEFAPQDSLRATPGLRVIARLRDGIVLAPR